MFILGIALFYFVVMVFLLPYAAKLSGKKNLTLWEKGKLTMCYIILSPLFIITASVGIGGAIVGGVIGLFCLPFNRDLRKSIKKSFSNCSLWLKNKWRKFRGKPIIENIDSDDD